MSINKDNFDWTDKFFVNDMVEKSIIRYLLNNHSKFRSISEKISKKLFTNDALCYIFSILDTMYKQGKEWDWYMVSDIIKSVEDRPIDLEYPQSYISDLMVEVESLDANIELYIGQMIEVHSRQSVYENIDKLKSYITDPTKSLNATYTLLKEFEATLMASNNKDLSVEVKKDNLVEFYLKEAEAIAKSVFYGSGFPSLDQHLAWGFHVPHLSVICGRPSTGKSLLRKCIQSNLYDRGIPNMLISREQSLFSEITRMVSQLGEIPMTNIIRTSQWLNDESLYAQIVDVLKYMEEKWPIHLIEPFGAFVLNDIKQAVIAENQKGFFPRQVFVDLFAQLDDVNESQNQAQVIQKKVVESANIAKELSFHMCLVVHLRRYGKMKNEANIDHKEQLKGSGGYEERSDLVLMTNLPGKYSEEIENNIMEVTILKQRDGKADVTVPLDFNPECMTLKDMTTSSNLEEVESFDGKFNIGGKIK